MTIASYAELIVTVGNKEEYGNISHVADLLTGMAEKYLGKKLRVSDMETAATLVVDSDGNATLPTDFLEMLSVHRGVYPITSYSRYHIKNTSLSPRCGYAITKGNLLFYPASGDSADILYYASLPGLVTNDTNWLLVNEPEVYIHAVTFQALVHQRKYKEAELEKAYLDQLIGDLNMADYAFKDRNVRVSVKGHTP